MKRPPSPPLTISPTCPPPLLPVVAPEDVEVQNSQSKNERFEVSKGGNDGSKYRTSITRKEESRASEKN